MQKQGRKEQAAIGNNWASHQAQRKAGFAQTRDTAAQSNPIQFHNIL